MGGRNQLINLVVVGMMTTTKHRTRLLIVLMRLTQSTTNPIVCITNDVEIGDNDKQKPGSQSLGSSSWIQNFSSNDMFVIVDDDDESRT